MSERLLIVNADDFGLTPGVCEAILHSAHHGVVTSTSALVTGPAFAAHAAALRDSGLGVGAHLCVVGEDRPVLSAAEVPTLVGPDGRFPLTWKQFLARATRGRVDMDDLRRELFAQVEVMAAAGLRLTHVDSHQNLHLWPQVATVAFEIAASRGITAMRVTRSAGWSPTSAGVRALSALLERRGGRHGLAVPGGSTGLDEAGHMTEQRLLQAITRLGSAESRSAEIAVHPGTDDDPDRSRYAWGYEWSAEFAAVCSPNVRRAVADAGFRLGDFSELAAS